MNKVVLQTILDMDKLKGFKIHKLDNDNLKCFEIPRNLIRGIKDVSTINNAGIYFLISEEENSLYVGQTDNILNRINDHNREEKKEFNKIIAFVNDNNSFSRTFIDYLEWHYISELKKGNSWKFMNAQLRDKKPNVSEFEEPTLIKMISEIDTLLFCTGITINANKSSSKRNNIFICNKAKGVFENGKITILAGSFLPDVTPKLNNLKPDNTYFEEQKNIFSEMIRQMQDWEKEEVVCRVDDEYKVLIDIKSFSPSKSGNIARGFYAVNGWVEWKNEKGETLDQVYRKNIVL